MVIIMGLGVGRLRGDCRTLSGPLVKRGSPWWSPKPTLVPVAWAGAGSCGPGRWREAMAGCDGGMRWRDAGLQVLEDGHQWWKLRNRSGQAGYVPGNILAETRLEDAPQEQVRGGLPCPTMGRRGRGEVAKDPARTPPCGD